ncbi:MAG: hypothetical protein OZSIB_2794 [Candidatus Ozemobacter sibiricus]|uniref:Uncharacterized protein n=1 Tax=Candidatus Ozemobacter sibiricus TaxID=2268124 RepID=A0A367ZSA0_9BACT|nr:MAG: hypothetical protein OZSIB_2794 [Candidatus Ozemobacter sibiricus]
MARSWFHALPPFGGSCEPAGPLVNRPTAPWRVDLARITTDATSSRYPASCFLSIARSSTRQLAGSH